MDAQDPGSRPLDGYLRPRGPQPSQHAGLARGAVVVLLALDSSFVIWAASGLENPLLAFLLAVSAVLASGAGSDDRARIAAGAGLVAGLLALTRPDAVLYAAAYPMAVVLSRARPRRVRRLALHVAVFAAVFGGYLLFRRVYFGDWVPNTFHAKVRPWMFELDPARLIELVEATVGPLAWPALALVAAGVVSAARGRAPRRMLVLGVHLLLSAAAYLLLPPDWMGEYRFGTGFFLFFYWSMGEALSWLWTALASVRARAGVPAFLAVLVLLSAGAHARRTREFAAHPTVPFARIAQLARGYDTLAAAVGRGPYSLLTPDLGGMLFFSGLRIYDLAGLCDRTVARTLMGHRDAFHDYVFTNARPTFIHIHGTWSDWAALHGDPRFARDYVALDEEWARPEGASPGEGEPWGGDYVRREVLRGPADVPRVAATFRELRLDHRRP
jgi:hypothetical protein